MITLGRTQLKALADDQFIGRVTAWDRSIKATGDNSLMVVTVWEPGKPKDTHQYYLVRE